MNMSKIEEALQKQLQNKEYAQDAIDCMRIYKKLLEMNDGQLWRNVWNVLVNVRVKRERELVMIYHPTDVGKVFLRGVGDNKKINLYMVFGGNAASYADSNDPEEFNSHKATMDYDIKHLTFDTKDELEAYLQGLDDGNGWEGYTPVTKKFYDLIKD